MKTLKVATILTILIATCAKNAFGQEGWSFFQPEETYSNELFVTSMPNQTRLLFEKQLRVKVNNRYKRYYKAKKTHSSLYGEYHVSQPKRIRNHEYVCLSNQWKDSLYMPLDAYKQLLEYTISPIAIEQLCSLCAEQCGYINFQRLANVYDYSIYNKLGINQSSKMTKDRIIEIDYTKYLPVDYISYRLHSKQDPFVAKVSITGVDTIELSYLDIMDIKDKYLFESKTVVDEKIAKKRRDVERKQRKHEKIDSIQNTKPFIAIAKTDHECYSLTGDTVYIYEGDTIALYYFNSKKDRFQGFYNHNEITLTDKIDVDTSHWETGFYEYNITNNIRINQSIHYYIGWNDACFLIKKENDGALQRKDVARITDSVHTINRLKKYLEAIRHLQIIDSLENSFIKNEIFIVVQEYVYGDYDYFGLKLRYFNCFDKTIKYIETEITPYNRVGDVEPDDLWHSSRLTRLIGPLEPKESCYFTNDELFKDEKDVISRLVVSSVIITFMDNSTKTYNGHELIQKHTYTK